MTNKHQPGKKILLAVSGLSPQIITETLYALAVQESPAFIPDEIHVITTLEGRKRIELMLLDPVQGHLVQMKRDYPQLVNIILSPATIHTIETPETEQLNDIRTPEDNEHCANTIFRIVQQLTHNRETVLHVSIAGGRKTMGFYLGNALSLLGRPQDRLSHVLVSEPFENDHQFYYPPPVPKVLIIHQTREPVSTAEARIMLAEIPFVRLRAVLPEELIAKPVAYSQAIEVAQALAPVPELLFDETTAALVLSGKPVKLPASEMALYYQLLLHLLEHRDGIHASDSDFHTEYLACYAYLFSTRTGHYERIERRLLEGCHSDYIEQTKSRINRKIKDALGIYTGELYRIKNSGARPVTRSVLDIPVEAIKLVRKNS